jgi:hypothetical protein
MRRWFVLALAPTGLLAAHALVLLSGGVARGPGLILDGGLLLGLVLLMVEGIGLVWLGGSLVQRWPALRHERWSLPIGVAGGFLPWLLLMDADAAATTVTALVGWVLCVILLGMLVGVVRSRQAARWTAVGGGVVLVLLIPFLVARAAFGAALVPWWSAPLLTPAALLGAAVGPVGLQLMAQLSLVSLMVLFGSALYLATVVTRAPSTVERISW